MDEEAKQISGSASVASSKLDALDRLKGRNVIVYLDEKAQGGTVFEGRIMGLESIANEAYFRFKRVKEEVFHEGKYRTVDEVYINASYVVQIMPLK